MGCSMVISLDSFEQVQRLKSWLEEHAKNNPLLQYEVSTTARPCEEMKKQLMEMLATMFFKPQSKMNPAASTFTPKLQPKPQLSRTKKQLLSLFYQGLAYQSSQFKPSSSRLKEQAVQKTQQLEKEFALAEVADEEESKEVLQRLGLRIMGEFVSLNPLNYLTEERLHSVFEPHADIT